MKEPQKIIRRPWITEKSTRQKEESGQYAIERVFKVKVLEVRTSNVMGKMKRLGKRYGKRPDWKKAIITLREGDRIDFFEGA
jgi:large subunit ribosomal protein L23